MKFTKMKTCWRNKLWKRTKCANPTKRQCKSYLWCNFTKRWSAKAQFWNLAASHSNSNSTWTGHKPYNVTYPSNYPSRWMNSNSCTPKTSDSTIIHQNCLWIALTPLICRSIFILLGPIRTKMMIWATRTIEITRRLKCLKPLEVKIGNPQTPCSIKSLPNPTSFIHLIRISRRGANNIRRRNGMASRRLFGNYDQINLPCLTLFHINTLFILSQHFLLFLTIYTYWTTYYWLSEIDIKRNQLVLLSLLD
jgi:hypothetical protein